MADYIILNKANLWKKAEDAAKDGYGRVNNEKCMPNFIEIIRKQFKDEGFSLQSLNKEKIKCFFSRRSIKKSTFKLCNC
ncbi:MAG: hypothetical protein H0X29_08710 [Parachlamydiaceae bacterium]|nr:hypothetical protein [Parachlamydiaceae bacterium]